MSAARFWKRFLNQINLKRADLRLRHDLAIQRRPAGARPIESSKPDRKRARMEGFLCTDYMSRAEEAFTQMIGWLMQGKLKYRVDVVQGLENAPQCIA